jgi:hypothetical protein
VIAATATKTTPSSAPCSAAGLRGVHELRQEGGEEERGLRVQQGDEEAVARDPGLSAAPRRARPGGAGVGRRSAFDAEPDQVGRRRRT